MFCNSFRLLVWPLLILALPSSANGQTPAGTVCAQMEHRQFDFWIGRWTVTDTNGRVLGTNVITRIASGCGLHERWQGAGTSEGMSLNVWQPGAGQWTQFWVGAGVVLHLIGGLDDEGRMVLAGDRETANGVVRDRITWARLSDGTVRQSWDVSRDRGVSWESLFEGLYQRQDHDTTQHSFRSEPGASRRSYRRLAGRPTHGPSGPIDAR